MDTDVRITKARKSIEARLGRLPDEGWQAICAQLGDLASYDSLGDFERAAADWAEVGMLFRGTTSRPGGRKHSSRRRPAHYFNAVMARSAVFRDVGLCRQLAAVWGVRGSFWRFATAQFKKMNHTSLSQDALRRRYDRARRDWDSMETLEFLCREVEKRNRREAKKYWREEKMRDGYRRSVGFGEPPRSG